MIRKLGFAAAAISSTCLIACNDSGSSSDDTPAATTQAVTISFAAKAGSQPVQCGTTLPAMGSSAVTSQLVDARIYLHDVKLIKATGEEVELTLTQNDWQYLNTALLDFENATGTGSCASTSNTAATNTSITGTVPSGNYVGLVFNVGVPVSAPDAAGKAVSLNHSDYATASKPLDIQAMAWSWQSGRKFMKVEVAPTGGITKAAGGTATTWFMHLGSTGCTGNPATGATTSCTSPNRFPVRFSSFNSSTQQVVLDIATLLQNSNLSQENGGAVGCMSGASDPECPAIFNQLDLNLTETTAGAGNAGAPKGNGSNPKIFRVELKS